MGGARKYRSFTGILYPDSTAYSCAEKLDILKECFPKWAFVLHDKDVNEDGELKKPHYHWVGYRENGVQVSTIAKFMDLPEAAVEFGKFGWRALVRYLTHIDHPEKTLYPVEDVTCNFNICALLQDELTSDDMAKSILNYLVSSGCSSTRQLVAWAIDNGVWSELRRSSGLWSAIMLENRNDLEWSK